MGKDDVQSFGWDEMAVLAGALILLVAIGSLTVYAAKRPRPSTVILVTLGLIGVLPFVFWKIHDPFIPIGTDEILLGIGIVVLLLLVLWKLSTDDW